MSRVFDVSMFHWEFDLLELRMRELWDVVDNFVITESLYDHRGKPRELLLEKNLDRFDWAKDKMIINASNAPDVANDSWDYERHHRRESIRAVDQFNPEDSDLFLVSDMDEIFRASTVKEITGEDGIYTMHMPMYYFYFNLFVHDWYQPTAISYKYINDLDRIRDCGGYVLRNAGWHFSYLGSEEDILHKLKTFAHDEYDTPEFANMDNIKRALEKREDLFGRDDGVVFKARDIDESWPQYFKDNIEKYERFII